jgi:hypothetical protein
MKTSQSVPSTREEHLRRAEQLAASSLDLTAKVDSAAAVATGRLYLDCAKETTYWDGEQWVTSFYPPVANRG